VHCTKISPEFECQGQRSRLPGTKKNKTAESSTLTMHSTWRRVRCRPYAARSRDDSIVWPLGVTGWRQCTLTAACVRFCRERSLRSRQCQWENERMLSSFRQACLYLQFLVYSKQKRKEQQNYDTVVRLFLVCVCVCVWERFLLTRYVDCVL